MEALCAHLPLRLLHCAFQTRLCRMRNTYCSLSGRIIWRSIIRSSDGHTGLADHRRSVPADWNYGVLFFSTENPAVPHRGLALVSRNTGSCYRIRSGRRANHGGPLLLYSVNRFVHCASVRISGHRQELACCAALSAGIAGGVLLILATLTNAQIQRWRDSFTLFEHTLAVTPPNLHIEHNLGLALGGSGRYDEAAAHFEKALQIDPNFYDGLVGMGVTREFQGRLPEAIDYFQAAIRSQPDTPKAHVQLGRALWKQNRDQAALEEMRRASQLAPKDADIRADFGLALAAGGQNTGGYRAISRSAPGES